MTLLLHYRLVSSGDLPRCFLFVVSTQTISWHFARTRQTDLNAWIAKSVVDFGLFLVKTVELLVQQLTDMRQDK